MRGRLSFGSRLSLVGILASLCFRLRFVEIDGGFAPILRVTEQDLTGTCPLLRFWPAFARRLGFVHDYLLFEFWSTPH